MTVTVCETSDHGVLEPEPRVGIEIFKAGWSPVEIGEGEADEPLGSNHCNSIT